MPNTQHNLRLFRVLMACGLLTLAGCASPVAPGNAPASMARAEQLLQQGNPAAAAQMYETLASGNPAPDRNDMLLAAARAWLAANRANDAVRITDAAASGLTAAQLFERELIRGEIALARGQYTPALQQLSKVAAPTKSADASRLFLLQQQLALRAGQYVEGVRAGMERERVAATDAERTRFRRELLTDLRAAIARGLRIDPAASRDATIRGWLELAQIAAAAGTSPLGAPAAVDRWRRAFPAHPATGIAVSEIIAPGERGAAPGTVVATPGSAVSAIALLLPLGSRQSQAATAAALIRDGFMAAVTRLPEAARPVVRTYDTAALDVATALKNASADGARLVVGPLTREEVQSAVQQRVGNSPLLLLNNLAGSGAAGSGIYQYALAPEDEARQIARQMVALGQRSVLMLTPTTEWGVRVAAAFTDELTQAGGAVIAQSSYTPESADLIAKVTTVLGVDESRDRYEKVRRITGTELVFEPTARPDIDAVLVAGRQPLDLRQIYPLVHRYAESLPVYTTQDGLDADQQANRDLAGVYLPDIPWMIDSAGPAADLRSATESAWGSRGVRQSRYFAFGFDAAMLAMTLGNRSAAPVSGLTGRLSINADGRVERSNLTWARVAGDGTVQPAALGTGSTPP